MIKSVVFFLGLVVSCGNTIVTQEQNSIKYDVIQEHAIGGRTDKDIVVISDKNTLEKIYDDLNLNQDPNYEVPDIDFNAELVIVFFMGEKNTGGYSISVKDINETNEYVFINYQEKGPKPTDMVTMVITQPYCIIKTKKPSKELQFIKVE